MISSVLHYLQLISDSDPCIRRLAVTEGASVSTWLELIEKHPELCEDVALNKELPIEILELLANNASKDVRFTIAMKRNLPETLIQHLASDSCESVRSRIAFNKKTPLWILRQLATDPSELVSTKAQERLNEESGA